MQIYSEHLQKFRLAAQGHGDRQPPDHLRPRIETYFDPLPFWYTPFEEEAVDNESFPLHAVTQRPMHMYHSWGSQNAWLRQITARNRLFIHPSVAEELSVTEDDWVWIVSHHGRVKAQIKPMAGVNPHTVWTWNAIGKRKGAWGLTPDAPEAKQGFLLNHVISELLPPKADGQRYSNSDPVTGQAAWYDLRVRLEKCTEGASDETEPAFDTLPGLAAAPKPAFLDADRGILRYGAALKGAPIVNSEVCQYTNTSNGDFLIDRHPRMDNVWLVGGGSGHGFKHGPAIGEYVAARIDDGAAVDPRFSLATKQTVQKRTVY